MKCYLLPDVTKLFYEMLFVTTCDTKELLQPPIKIMNLFLIDILILFLEVSAGTSSSPTTR